MESPGIHSTASSKGKPKVDDLKNMVFSKQADFLSSYRCQDWSLPKSLIYNIAKHPSFPKLYQKMIQTCKYFFIKNPILILSDPVYDDNKWHSFGQLNSYDLSKSSLKIWVTKQLYSVDNSNMISSLIPKLYRCDIEVLDIRNQDIYYNNLQLLTLSAEGFKFENVTVRNADDSIVVFEKIFQILVKAKYVDYFCNTAPSDITTETMKELEKIPHFLKLENLLLSNIPDIFDLEDFYAYMKKNKLTGIFVYFANSISPVYRNRLEGIIDEIIATNIFTYNPPLVHFPGLNREKYHRLRTSPNFKYTILRV